MSVLQKEIIKEVELSETYIQAGFHHAHLAGELLAEVEELVGTDKLKEYCKETFPDIQPAILRQCLKLFKGETVKIEVTRQKQELKPEEEL